MSRKATPINLAKEEKPTLKKWLRASKAERRIVLRAQIILLADQGKPGKDIAASMKVREATVCKWRARFAKERLGGLQDAPRSDVPAKVLRYRDLPEKVWHLESSFNPHTFKTTDRPSKNSST